MSKPNGTTSGPALVADRCDVAAALAFVAVGPRKTLEWQEQASRMCGHCQPYEDVADAAARLLAAEVLRLQGLLAAGSRSGDDSDWKVGALRDAQQTKGDLHAQIWELKAENRKLRNTLAEVDGARNSVCCVCGATPAPHEIREMSPRCGQRLCDQCQRREARENAAFRYLAS